jgi:hypothetical protein
MPYYRVMLHGAGIRVPSQEPDNDLVGFYTTRLVRTLNESEALKSACTIIKNEWSLGGSRFSSNKGSFPDLSLEWVKKTSFLDIFFFRATGYIFYFADENVT